MVKKVKTNEADKLKAGDVIETDQGEKFELDAAQADDLNKQVEDSKEDSAKLAKKNTGNNNRVSKAFGTFRFQQKNKGK